SSTSDSGSDLPILTDAVEVTAGTDDDAREDEKNEPESEPEAASGDGYDDVEALPDISAAMAETLFGDSDLDLLGAALAAGSWEDVESSSDALPSSGRAPFAGSATNSGTDADLAPFAARAAHAARRK